MPTQQTILLVENDAGFAYTLWSHLKASGYRVVIANSAMAALEQWESDRIDIVIADISLPRGGPDGVLLTRMIRHESADVPILLIGHPDLVNDREDDHPGRVIHKPVELSTLRQAVQDSLAA